MEFCQKCGGVILVQNNKAICLGCGSKAKKRPKIQIVEKEREKGGIAVINEKENAVYPVVEITCPQCKNGKAYFWTTQTRAADESETKFYKCVKCGHTWRIYR